MFNLYVVQHGQRLAEVVRPEVVANLPHVTDSDQQASKPVVERLKTEGKLQVGYFDLLLFDGKNEIDGSTEIC